MSQRTILGANVTSVIFERGLEAWRRRPELYIAALTTFPRFGRDPYPP
jgi:hypothetical protein